LFDCIANLLEGKCLNNHSLGLTEYLLINDYEGVTAFHSAAMKFANEIKNSFETGRGLCFDYKTLYIGYLGAIPLKRLLKEFYSITSLNLSKE